MDWEEVLSSLEVDRSVGEVDWAQPGSCGGMTMLESFIDQRLRLFATHRNNPNCDALSHLSPWIHAGQFALRLSALLLLFMQCNKWGSNLFFTKVILWPTEVLQVWKNMSVWEIEFLFYTIHFLIDVV